VHCPQCGAALAQGARYCTACGTALVQPTLPPGAAPAFPGPAAAPARKDTRTAQTVILVGAALSAVLGVLFGLLLMFFGAFFGAMFGGSLGGLEVALFGGVALVVIAVGLLFGFGGLHARNLVRDGDPEKGGLLAIVLGVLLLFTGNAIAGIVMAGGGVLAYQAR
jgi:hypothetical protein